VACAGWTVRALPNAIRRIAIKVMAVVCAVQFIAVSHGVIAVSRDTAYCSGGDDNEEDSSHLTRWVRRTDEALNSPRISKKKPLRC